jgi:hypothetical protein
MRTALNIFGIITTALVLAGCAHQTSQPPAPQSGSLPAETTPAVSPTPKPLTPQSSGDADQDMAEIEAAIDKLDVEADFPTFTADDL